MGEGVGTEQSTQDCVAWRCMAEDPTIRRHATISANSFCSLFCSADSSCNLSREAHNQGRAQPI